MLPVCPCLKIIVAYTLSSLSLLKVGGHIWSVLPTAGEVLDGGLLDDESRLQTPPTLKLLPYHHLIVTHEHGDYVLRAPL